MTFKAYEFDSAHEAIQHMEAQGGVAIRWEGKNLVVSEETADRLAVDGAEFAYLCDYEGRIVTVPVN